MPFMLGYSHATSAAALWFAAAPAALSVVGQSLTPQQLAAGAVACAGAGLIPDIDHPSGTIAYTFGPLTRGVAKLVALLAGGHRQGTHTLLFAIGFGAFCYGIGQSSEYLNTQWPAMILMFALASFAFKGMRLVPKAVHYSMRGVAAVLQAAALTWALAHWVMPGMHWGLWLGAAGFLGCFAHLVTDSCTPEGVPWLKPLTNFRLSVPLISHTGNVVETVIVGPLFTLAVIILGWTALGPSAATPLFG